MIFPRIKLPSFVQFKQYQGKILSTIKGLGSKPPNRPETSRMVGLSRHTIKSSIAVGVTTLGKLFTRSWLDTDSHRDCMASLDCVVDLGKSWGCVCCL